jgi:hypothetical protein
LFIVFINDILTDINLTKKLFVDDTSLYLIVDDPQETAQTLNDDLVKLHAWSTKWLVNFNPQKTETMTISRKLKRGPRIDPWGTPAFMSRQLEVTPGDSAVNQLLYITNEFGRALDEGKEVRVVFLRYKKVLMIN